MRISLPFLDQIRSLRIKITDPTIQRPEDSAQYGGGGFIADTLSKVVASLLTSYHHEHNDDDTHKSTITLDGVPLGLWSGVTAAEAAFTGSGAMTVTGVTITTLRYTIINRLMIVTFYFSATVGGAPATYIIFNIPALRMSTNLTYSACSALDGGALLPAFCFVHAFTGARQIGITKLDGTNWTAGAVSAWGQIAFELAAS